MKNYSDMCERVIELCTETGKEMNDHLSKAVINPFEVKLVTEIMFYLKAS